MAGAFCFDKFILPPNQETSSFSAQVKFPLETLQEACLVAF
jgi:hypothetical protein